MVGILASRIKDKLHRPVFAFARGDGGQIKGSGRSIPGLHLRDALDLVSKRAPGILLRFGGHAMAAGATLMEENFERFKELFAQVADELLNPADLTRTLETDGGLETGYISLQVAQMLAGEVWGQGFPPPLFEDVFEVESQRVLKEKHLKMSVCHPQSNRVFDAIAFNVDRERWPNDARQVRLAYRLGINEFRGSRTLQLMVEYLEPAFRSSSTENCWLEGKVTCFPSTMASSCGPRKIPFIGDSPRSQPAAAKMSSKAALMMQVCRLAECIARTDQRDCTRISTTDFESAIGSQAVKSLGRK